MKYINLETVWNESIMGPKKKINHKGIHPQRAIKTKSGSIDLEIDSGASELSIGQFSSTKSENLEVEAHISIDKEKSHPPAHKGKFTSSRAIHRDGRHDADHNASPGHLQGDEETGHLDPSESLTHSKGKLGHKVRKNPKKTVSHKTPKRPGYFHNQDSDSDSSDSSTSSLSSITSGDSLFEERQGVQSKINRSEEANGTIIDLSSDGSAKDSSTAGIDKTMVSKVPDKEVFTKFLFKDHDAIRAKCPKGMEYLINEDIIYLNPVYQFEGGMLGSHVSASRFEVLNSNGNEIFYVEQKTICCSRFVIFSSQTFKTTFYDVGGKIVFEVCGPKCFLHINLTAVKVILSSGELIGKIKTSNSFRADYTIFGNDRKPALKIKGLTCCPKAGENFAITLPSSNQEIGSISKTWKMSHLGDTFLDFETAGVSFLPEMDVKLKALAIGALIFIEFQWYNKHTRFSYYVLIFGILCICIILGLIVAPIFFEVEEFADDSDE